MAIDKLYKTLKEKGLYTKSFEEFEEKFRKVEYRKQVHQAVVNEGLYTKDLDAFEDKYLNNLTFSNIGSTLGQTALSLGEGTIDLLEEGQASLEFLGKQFEKYYEGKSKGIFEPLTVKEKDVIRDRIKATGIKIPFGLQGVGSGIKSKSFDPLIENLQKNIVTYDDTIGQALNKDDVDWTEVGSRIATGVVGSIPSLILATNPMGLTVLGASSAGNKWEEEYEESPETAASLLFANAAGTGLIEAAGEYFTGRLVKASGIMGRSGAPTEAIKQLNKSAGEQFAKILYGFGQEGATEFAQSFGTKVLESLPKGIPGGLGKKVDWEQAAWEALDEGIIGGFSGGGVRTLGSIGDTKSVRRRRAETTLASPESRRIIKQSYDEIKDLEKGLQNADETTREIIEEKIDLEIDKIYDERIKSSKALSNLSDKDLIDYAKNIEKLNSINKSFKNPDNIANKRNLAELKNEFDKIEKQNNELLNKAVEKNLQTNLRSAKKAALKRGIKDFKVVSQEEFKKLYKKTDEGKDLDDNQLSRDAREISGYYDKKSNTIVINETSAKNFGMVTVGSHELLHPILNSVMGSSQSQADKVAEFKNILSGRQRRLMDQEMADRGYTKEDEATEYFNVFLDAVADKNSDIAFEKNLYTRIGDFLKSIFSSYNINNMDFKDANGVFNFLKAYQEGVQRGEFTKEVSDIIGDLGNIESEVGIDTSRNASANVQRIYEQRGVDGAFDIIQEFAPIVNNIVNKFRNVPGFDANLLTDEINTGRRGILDMIREYDPEKAKGAPLAAYINSFIKQRSIEAANRILKTEFETDVSEARGVAVEETTTPEISDKPRARKINPIDFVLDSDLKQKYIDDVVDKLKDLDPATLTFKNLKDLSAENTAKIFNVPTKKVVDPTANLTKQEKENALKFIRANALDLISLLPKGAVTESASEKLLGTSTGVPKSLLNKFYTKQDRITTGAGLSPFTKNNNITRKTFLEAFGIIDGQKSTDFGPRTPEAQAVKAMMSLYGKLATNSIVRDQLRKQGELQSVIQDIAAGKSSVQFSRAVRRQFDLKLKGRLKVDTLLAENGLDKSLNLKEEIKTPEGRQRIVQNLKNNVVVLLPKEAWLGPRGGNVFTTSGKDYGITGNVTQEQRQSLNDLRVEINNMLNDSDTKFGDPIEGISDYSVSSYNTIFNARKKTIQDGAKEFNDKVTAIHKELWARINKSIRNDNTGTVAPGVATYLKLVANHTGHWHKLGAAIYGYSPNPKAKGKTKYEYEHAMPATAAYLYLLDAAINKTNFNTSYELVMNNYKLIALDKVDNKKLGLAKLGRTMPDNWDILDNNWWQRYFNETVAQIDGGIDPNTIVDLDGNTLANALNIYKDGSNILSQQELDIIKNAEKANEGMFDILIKGQTLNKQTKDLKIIDKAINFSRVPRPEKGISIFDFDQTLANTKEKVIVNMPDGTSTKIDAAEFARTAEQLEQEGAKFDFTEFDKVKGATKGPFFELAQKIKGKFGNKDIFILTARPQNAAPAIQRFLKGVGLDIRIENITGLEDGSPQAKARFVAEKVTEGYNNFFFGDDAYKNVKAVQEILNIADVKSDVQQAKIQFSRNLSKRFNEIISENKGIDPNARFSEAAAKVRGAKADKFWSRLFVPPSAEDFKGLLYMLVGKGRKGEQQMMFLEDALIKPFARAFRDINAARQKVSNQYDQLKKDLPNIKRNLLQATDYNNFTFDQAIRVYLMNKNDIEIPGISQRDVDALIKVVEANPQLVQYADRLSQIIGKEEGYIVPSDVSWLSSTIEQDLKDLNNKVNRSEYLSEWINNKNEIFNEDNLNKLEALYGRSYREALEDILYRMEIGSNRPAGQNKLVNDFTTWVNNAVGNIMFLNVRTSVLQTISFANFVNWSDNNPIKYMQAVANFPQFASDFAMIWNSDFLKQRRKGLQTDVSASEIVNQAANSKNKVSAILSYILGKGYLPTQMGDSFAICMGGAGFYRNRVKSYIKQGLSESEAEAKAFADMQETSEDAQQSARPDKISQQQAGPLGRFILAFQNTPMQYTRMIKKSGLDLLNRRRVRGLSQTQSDMTHISKILYYGAMQNFIFSALQNALFALAFSDVEEEEEKQKYSRIANNMADTILRGTGVYGAAASTLKNIALQFIRQEKKGSRADHAYTIIEGVNLSPPIGSKIRKLYSATQAVKFNRDEIAEMGFDIDNPAYDAVANTVSAVTNVPLDRAIRITDNARAALDKNNEAWQRIALALGWNTWDLGIQPQRESTGKKRKNKKRKIRLF